MLFKYDVNNQITLSMVELGDTDEIFSLVNNSRDYLRWLTWVDLNISSADTRKFWVSYTNEEYNSRPFDYK